MRALHFIEHIEAYKMHSYSARKQLLFSKKVSLGGTKVTDQQGDLLGQNDLSEIFCYEQITRNSILSSTAKLRSYQSILFLFSYWFNNEIKNIIMTTTCQDMYLQELNPMLTFNWWSSSAERWYNKIKHDKTRIT